MYNMRYIFNNYVEMIKSNKLISRILTLSLGAVIGQAINFIGLPIISRLYSPDEMGMYYLFLSSSDVISAIICLGMMTAFMLPKDDDESKCLCTLVACSSLFGGLLIVVLLWILKDVYVIIHSDNYTLCLMMLWLQSFLSVINGICNAYVNRHKLYRILCYNLILNALLNNIICIVLGLISNSFIIMILARMLSLIVSSFYLIKMQNPFIFKLKHKYSYYYLLNKYKRFYIFQLPANIISSLSIQLPLTIIEQFYAAIFVGYYSMAMRILSLPGALLSGPINRVFYQEATERYNNGENIGEFALKILETNIRLAIVPVGILIIFGEVIFSIFLGDQWQVAGIYAGILGIYQLMQFCMRCLSGDFVIIGKNSWNLISALFGVFIYIGLYVYLIYSNQICSIEIFILYLSVFMTLKMMIAQGVFLFVTGADLIRYINFIMKYIIVPYIIVIYLYFLR